MNGVWKRIVVLPLCICLLSACGTARNQVLSVRTSETDRLRDLLDRKRIDASFADGTRVGGRVQEVQDGLLAVDVKESTGPSPSGTGLQSIPTDRISTIRFTRHKGFRRFLLGPLFALGGAALGMLFVSAEWQGASWSVLDRNVMAGATVGTGVLGYFLGRQKDKQSVTLEIQPPDASEGP